MNKEGILKQEKQEVQDEENESNQTINSELSDLINIGECSKVQLKNQIHSLDNVVIIYKKGLKVKISKVRDDLFLITYDYNCNLSAAIEKTVEKVITEIKRKYNSI